MQLLLLLPLLPLLPVLFSGKVQAQQSPFYNTTKYDQSVSHRHNFCDIQRAIFDDLISLPDALRGLNLSAVLIDYTGHNEEAFFALNEQGEIKSADPGLYVKLLDELAERAGFTWRDTFGVVKPLNKEEDGNRTWTDLLIWTTETYDLTVDYFTKNPERIAKEVSFPEGWYDSSLILVRREKTSNLSLLSFLQPFETGVWCLIVASIIVTGLLYWLLDRTDKHADARELGDKPLGAIFLSAIVFTNHFEFRPNSTPAQLLALSWAFWALITGAAYTANLASFLVNRNENSGGVTSLSQAVRENAPICVKRHTANEGYVQRYYPGANLVRFETHQETFEALQAGECDVLATQEGTFLVLERSKAANKNCKLRRVGRTELIRGGGFATTIDTGTFCTSLASAVLDYHLMQMKADGFIENSFNAFLDATTDHTCASSTDSSNSNADESYRLSIEDMGGIFILHGIVCGIILIILSFQIFSKERTRRLDSANDGDVGKEDEFRANSCNHVSADMNPNENKGLSRRSSKRVKRLLLGDERDRRRSMWEYPSPSSRPVLMQESLATLRESSSQSNGLSAVPEHADYDNSVRSQSI